MEYTRTDENSNFDINLQKTPIAIIGMASIFPQARNLKEYWENILRKVDCITDVPPSRWHIEDYYDPDPSTPDKTYCKKGGFIPDIDFNPIEFGLPPNILEVTDISQLLALVVAKDVLADAGYLHAEASVRERTGVILGVVGGSMQMLVPLTTRLQHPVWEKVLKSSGLNDADTQKIIHKLKQAYIGWEENSFPGWLGNVIAGRIANRLNLGGTNCVVDAACASSLAALDMAVSALIQRRCDMMITGGVDTDNSTLIYLSFSKTPAFSKSQQIKPFDADSDGMIAGEGLGMVVLKRLEDAERDGDRIYAVIRGIGTSSDGRQKSIYAPSWEGQIKALDRAYEQAGFSAASVGLIEAHGTGTIAGDLCEFTALKQKFSAGNGTRQHIALGSVKSQIGHTKGAAGAAGIIKTALALYHKILPPTINVTKPNPKFEIEDSPFYINTETSPWINVDGKWPRRAGVSAFGFGGVNYHTVLEEYKGEHNQPYRLHRSACTILLCAESPGKLLQHCEKVLKRLNSWEKERYYAELGQMSESLVLPLEAARVGFMANSLEQACALLTTVIELFRTKGLEESWEHPQGIYYRRTGICTQGRVVALFAGQGSQYLGMGRDIACNFPALRQAYSQMDQLFIHQHTVPLVSEVVFPPPAFRANQQEAQIKLLQEPTYAQAAIGAFSIGLYRILQQAGFEPNFTVGHSFGELTALWAAEVLSDEHYLELVKARGHAMTLLPESVDVDAGAMLAVKGNIAEVQELIKNYEQLSIANFNAKNQVVLAGASLQVAHVQKILTEQGYTVFLLPVAAAFHTSRVGYAQDPFARCMAEVPFSPAKILVYSNTTGKPYPTDPKAIRKNLEAHITNPVLFQDEIENIYAAGGDIFVEFGPKNILTNLVKNILDDKPHFAVALNTNSKQDSDQQLREAVLRLRVIGLPLQRLYPHQHELKSPVDEGKKVLNISLNGGNYVSEKTKAAFISALSNEHHIEPSEKSAASMVSTDRSQPEVDRSTPTPALRPVTAQNATPSIVRSDPQAPPSLKLVSYPWNLKTPQMPQIRLDNQRVLESLEQTIIEYRKYQDETLQVHGDYLNQQQEYAKVSLQLMQQHYAFMGSIVANTPVSKLASGAIESLERSMMQFHSNQGETLKVHEQYLNHQAEYAEKLFDLAQQQYALVANGSARANSVSPPTVPTLKKQESHVANDIATSVIISAPVVGQMQREDSKLSDRPAVTPQQIEKTNVPAVLFDFAALTQTLLEIVSAKTGYPVEMLDLEMDMEADLSIDSIKRIEILGTLQTAFPDLPRIQSGEMAELRTLDQILEYMRSQVAQTAKPIAIQKAETPGPQQIEKTNVPAVLFDFAALTQTLLEIVSAKTGYPVEMLDLEMDMEADLSIDSIKRIEILGTLQTAFPDLPRIQSGEMAELRTLDQILEYMRQQSADENIMLPDESKGEQLTSHQDEQSEINYNIQRRLVKLKLLPDPDFLELTSPKGHVCLLTADGSLTTVAVAKSLIELGWSVVVLHFPPSVISEIVPCPPEINQVRLEDLSEDHLKQQLTVIADHYGPISSFIHLNPLWQESLDDKTIFLEAEKEILRHVFLLAKHLKPSLNKVNSHERNYFLTIARLDGAFGLKQNTSFGAISAGLFGLTKSLKQEWEQVFCRALDLSPDLEPSQVAQRILDELHDPNNLLSEVGYTLKERSTLVCELLQEVPDQHSNISSASVFLVSGGAKGITAHCVLKLAEAYKCRFILLGRSSLAESEPFWAQGCWDEMILKQRIMEELLAQGEKPKPAKVESIFNDISSQREIEKTLHGIEKVGGQAVYCSVDVSNALLLQEQIQAAVAKVGPITGIIHGAGNLADKLIEKKTVKDFEKVYNAKVIGIENLLHCVPHGQIEHLVLFSSVVGFYGNVGQADYSMVNEILNKTAYLVKRSHPSCHVVAINWGPWASGMVTPEVAKVFAQRNIAIELIPVEVGSRMLVEELVTANQDIVQVVIGSPLIMPPSMLNPALRNYRIHRRMSLEANPFLEDHRIGDHAVLPAMCASAWMSNTCEQLYPHYRFFSRTNFRALKGIVFNETLPKDFVLDLKETSKTEAGEIEFEAALSSKGANDRILYHFKGQLKLVREMPDPSPYIAFNRAQEQMISGQSLYENGTIFHGPSFQGLECVLNVSPEKTTIRCILPKLGDRQQGQFPVQTFNPYIGDLQLQAGLFFLQYFYQAGCLPSQILHFEQFRLIPFDQEFYISLTLRSKTDTAMVADIVSHDNQGQVYTRAIGTEFTIGSQLRQLFEQSAHKHMSLLR